MKLSDFEMEPRYPGADVAQAGIVRLDFGKYTLSVVTGGYGDVDAPYEIAVISEGEFVQLPGITAPDDDVGGWLTEAHVNCIITKLYLITAIAPTQVLGRMKCE